jgi:hypothetical protein
MPQPKEQKMRDIPDKRTSGASTGKTYSEVYKTTRDHKAAVRAAYGHNVWATENAKATGNWK